MHKISDYSVQKCEDGTIKFVDLKELFDTIPGIKTMESAYKKRNFLRVAAYVNELKRFIVSCKKDIAKENKADGRHACF